MNVMLIELMEKNLAGSLTDAELENELRRRGFDNEEIEALWQTKEDGRGVPKKGGLTNE